MISKSSMISRASALERSIIPHAKAKVLGRGLSLTLHCTMLVLKYSDQKWLIVTEFLECFLFRLMKLNNHYISALENYGKEGRREPGIRERIATLTVR